MTGRIHIYCGDGKGKTSAAMGLALRAAGSGMEVLVLQFLKDGSSSEFRSLESAFGQAPENGLLVLDEALGARSAGVLDEDRLLALLRGKPAGLEVVLTGRGPTQALLDAADYVTEMKKVKHPFDQGVRARRGIEY